MSEKYIDLRDMILQDTIAAGSLSITEVLDWLDEHHDQVPGRTITESEFERVADTFPAGGPRLDLRNALTRFGFEFMEDRELSNAEKLKAALDEIGASTDGYREWLAEQLDEAGVKAPGGDDEQ